MIPTPEEIAKYILNHWHTITVPEFVAYIRERDRAILDEAERDCWNLAALRRKVLGE